MKTTIFALAVTCIIACVAAEVPIFWPEPVSYTYGTQQILVSPDLEFICQNFECDDFWFINFVRYQRYIFFVNNRKNDLKQNYQQSVVLNFVNITVNTRNLPLELGVDESYTIKISASGEAVIEANTDWGALRGLETFSQAVEFDTTNKVYYIPATPIYVQDSPRFQWRGLLIDSSRHFLSIPTVIRMIDAMSFTKMNMLHWHLTDSQSLPIESNAYPNLSQGAWYPSAVYTHDDLMFVVEYGRTRGVIVFPEFDMPGHATSYGVGYPQLIANCAVEPLVDPSQPFTYQFISGFFGEMADIFTSDYIHLGSDEVQYDCWNTSAILAWMQQNGLSTFIDAHSYFEGKVQKIVSGLNKQALVWEEAFDKGLAMLPTTIVDVWLSNDELFNVVKSGYRGILAHGYYLDQQNPGPENFYFWVDTWIDFYMNDPIGNATLTPDELSRILGGEACMWGEGVDDNVIDGRIWPRALAVGERLWSPQTVTDVNWAEERMILHRCKMVRRGIKASPIRPDFCYTGEHERNYSFF